MADPAVKLLGFRLVRPLDQLEQTGAGDEGDGAGSGLLEQRNKRFLCSAHSPLLISVKATQMLGSAAVCGPYLPPKASAGIRRDEPRFPVDQDGAQLVAVEVKLGGGGPPKKSGVVGCPVGWLMFAGGRRPANQRQPTKVSLVPLRCPCRFPPSHPWTALRLASEAVAVSRS